MTVLKHIMVDGCPELIELNPSQCVFFIVTVFANKHTYSSFFFVAKRIKLRTPI